jgi:hypothetical protein
MRCGCFEKTGHWVCAFEGYFASGYFLYLFLCFLATMREQLPMMLCLTMIGPEAMKSSDHGLKTLKPQIKISLSSFKWFSQVFCHSNNTPPNIQTNE